MKKYLFLFFFAAFFFQAAGQQYFITETQLQKLETICQNYKANNQTLQEQLQQLQYKAETLERDSKKLQEQLQAERKTTESLNRSLTQYENRCSQSEADKIQLALDLEQQKVKTGRWKITTLIVSICNLILVGLNIFYAYTKLRG